MQTYSFENDSENFGYCQVTSRTDTHVTFNMAVCSKDGASIISNRTVTVSEFDNLIKEFSPNDFDYDEAMSDVVWHIQH